MLIYREETFGPIAAVTPFDDEEQAIEMANDTAYGLASYVYTRDLGRAIRVSEALQVRRSSASTTSTRPRPRPRSAA